MKKIILASNNQKKLAELSAILAPAGIEPVTQGALGIPEIDEPHATFIENALRKARHAARLGGLPALADDSGLCVSALGGAPGVRSARYSGIDGGIDGTEADAANNARLLAELAAQQSAAERAARFVSVVVLLRHADDPEPLIGEGVWHGVIAHAPSGSGGFGYDPLFFLPEWQQTAAELAAAEKNRVSHRARALAALLPRLAEIAR